MYLYVLVHLLTFTSPPGTGKTSTICGLVEAFLHKRSSPATSIHVGRSSTHSDKGPVQKILLCAPSNAAIDEVASRLKEGYRGTHKRGAPIKVIRIGHDQSLDVSVKDISLDYLVEQKINGETTKNSSKQEVNDMAAVRQEIDSVKRARQEKFDELATIPNNTTRALALDEEIKQLNNRRMILTQQFDRLKDKQKSDNRTLDATRRRYRMEILQEADVICATLAGSGHDSIEQLEFEMIIIDEAAQAIELSSLIPLKFHSQRCIMVGGEPIPITVRSCSQIKPTRPTAASAHCSFTRGNTRCFREVVVLTFAKACRFQYNQSLFVRLQKHHPDAVHLLRWVVPPPLAVYFMNCHAVFSIVCTRRLASSRVVCFTSSVCWMVLTWHPRQRNLGTRIPSLDHIGFLTFNADRSSQHLRTL